MQPNYLTAEGEIIQRPIFWKTPFNHDTLAEAIRTGTENNEPTLAQQHGKEEADINTIVDRFLKTGTLPQVAVPPTFGDFDGEFDFQTAMNIVAAGKASFMALPAEIRDAFHNNPERFVATVNAMLEEPDEKAREANLATLRAMNLAVEPGPIADKTTLGDVLAAIKEQTAKGDSPAPEPS